MREGWVETALGAAIRVDRVSVSPSRMPAMVELYSIPGLDAGRVPELVARGDIGSNKFMVSDRAVLVSMLNPRILRTVVAQPGTYCSTEFAVLVPNLEILSVEYLAVLVSGRTFQERLTSAAKGTTGSRSRSKASDVQEMPAALPSLDEQRRIVDLIGALDDVIGASPVPEARVTYEQLLSRYVHGSYPKEPLKSALLLRTDTEKLDTKKSYRVLGVLRSGEGFIDRGAVTGAETNYTRLMRVGADQLVYRKLTAWEGPISVTSSSEEGGYVSQEFPVFEILSDRILPGLLRHLCRSPWLWKEVEYRLVGSVQRRKRLNPGALLGVEVPMPPGKEQEVLCGALDAAWELGAGYKAYRDRLSLVREAVVERLLSGEHVIPKSYDELIEEVGA